MFEEVRIEGDFHLSSGASTNVYYAVETLTPCEVAKYGHELIKKIPCDRIVDFIVTPAYGGIPLAFYVALQMHLPLIIIEKDDSLRGMQIDNRVGTKYLIVDDVVSTYAEIERVTKIMHKQVGCDPLGVACYMYRGEQERINPPLYYLEKKEVEK